jgi:hypothetical protein
MPQGRRVLILAVLLLGLAAAALVVFVAVCAAVQSR